MNIEKEKGEEDDEEAESGAWDAVQKEKNIFLSSAQFGRVVS